MAANHLPNFDKPDEELVLDMPAREITEYVQETPGLWERLRRLEIERRAAYSQMHRMITDIGTLWHDREHSEHELAAVQADLMYRLAVVVEQRRGEGAGKVLRVGLMAAMLAHSMGCDDDFCGRLQLAAPLHDVGEIALPDAIFGKPRFDDADRDLMRGHCAIGHALLAGSRLPELALAAEVAMTHHEHYDGEGYPNRLSGASIPLGARIVTVVDCFDALCSRRPYRPAYDPDEAVGAIVDGSGWQFDPSVIAAFRQIKPRLLKVRADLSAIEFQPGVFAWLEHSPESRLWKRFL